MPLALLLIPLFIFIIIFIVFSVSAFYHVARFELLNATTIVMSTLFVIGTLGIGIISTTYIMHIDWQERVSINIFETITPQAPAPALDSINSLSF